MFIFILAASITVAWSLVFHKAMRDERRRYQRLYKQTLEISEHNDELLQQLRKEKRENTKLRKEIQCLETQLKEQAEDRLREGKE
jgi:uncharacterized protein YlxW (UPF0749 family)